MKINPNSSALILIDFQGRLMPAIHEGKEILAQAIRIGKIAQILKIPVIGTEQSPQSLGNNAQDIAELCNTIISKDHFDACMDGLIDHIPKNAKQLVISGCETHVCVMQTALHLLKEGFEIFMLTDAVGSRKEIDKEFGLKRLSAAGAHLITVEMAAFEWLESAKNPNFKAVLGLIK